jgi:exopolysaccharide production protein ExoY
MMVIRVKDWWMETRLEGLDWQAPDGDRAEAGLVLDLTGSPPRVSLGGRSFVASPRPLGRWEVRWRRALDLVGAGVLLVLTAPVIALAGLAVVLSSRGPVFYPSRRVGWKGEEFGAWKLRSMYHDSEERLAELLAGDPALALEYATTRKLRDDPRVTVVGRFLRLSSIDELPQLWNVLRGEMALVGPRPKLPDETELYGQAFDTVLQVKPGLTGLWQVSGRSDLSFDERIFLDVKYVTERSLRGDLAICGRTVAQMWRPSRHGAA